jgi:hypothetical protein
MRRRAAHEADRAMAETRPAGPGSASPESASQGIAVRDDARVADARRSAWMAAAQAGDQVAYAALLRDCVGVIESVARRQGVPTGRIDDVVQDALLTVHRARQTYDAARSFTAWLRARP